MSYNLRTARLPIPFPLLVAGLLQYSTLWAATAAGDPQQDQEKASQNAVALSSCNISGLSEPARCGVVEVLENGAKAEGRRIHVHVVVIPAIGPKAARSDPIMPLAGGPGEGTIDAAADYATRLASVRQDRDLLLIDQRGTGQSDALHCELYSPADPAVSLRDFFPINAVENCSKQLQAHADLTEYTYARSVADLEYIRKSLGYGPVNLFAESYGTRAGQVYVRTYPKSVRTVYFGSIVAVDIPQPLPYAKAAQAALDKLLDDCAHDTACNTAFPDLRNESKEIFARVDGKPVHASVPGLPTEVSISRGRLGEWLRMKLNRAASSTDVPWMIHRAHLGDWTPIVEGILGSARGLDSGLSFGLFFSVTCSEDVAFIREEEIGPETHGTFLGDYRVRQQEAACQHWPKASLTADYRVPVRSTVPALFVAGDLDSGTPLWHTEHVAKGFLPVRR